MKKKSKMNQDKRIKKFKKLNKMKIKVTIRMKYLNQNN